VCTTVYGAHRHRTFDALDVPVYFTSVHVLDNAVYHVAEVWTKIYTAIVQFPCYSMALVLFYYCLVKMWAKSYGLMAMC